MLRWLVLALLVANLGFWAWRQGWLAPVDAAIGVKPQGEREPERLMQQVLPEKIRLVPAEAASTPVRPRAASAAATPGAPAAGPASAAMASEPASAALAAAAVAAQPVCLEAGPYALAEFAAAESSARLALPQAAWSQREIAPVWWVAMGPFADADTLQKKREELRRRDVRHEQAGSLQTGAFLVLSRHDSRAAADAQLATLQERGVRTARSLMAAPPQRALRLPQADPVQQAALAALGADALRGRSFAPCPSGAL